MRTTTPFFLITYLAAVALFISSCSGTSSNTNVAGTGSTQAAQMQQYVKLVIVYRTDSTKIIDSVPVAISGVTVKDAMDAAAKNKKLYFETKPGQYGMIDAIDGWHPNGTKQYWWLCVNDTCASAGFEDQKAMPGSTIAWHYITDGKQPCKNCSFNK